MPPELLVDLDAIDLDQVEIPIEKVREVNPQRYEMEQLSGILSFDPDNQIIIGFKDITDDEFWIRGHVPGRPLMPGVMIVEAAAQLCTYYYKEARNDDRFVGFGGIDNVKFRGTVRPGDKLILAAKNTELKSRRAIFECQGIVNGALVFQGTIIGMPV